MKVLYFKVILKIILVLTISINLIHPVFGQAPDIGSDSSFTIFTSSGAITNTGNTSIWGDIGTNAGAYNGSPTIYGNTHIVDAVSYQASIDAKNAYTFLTALSCDSVIVSPLGNNMTIQAGKIYCINTAAILNNDLILDANGNSNGVFIIKIDGAFTTSSNSRILLQNGASFCNVYWQINGIVTLGSNSTFEGNIFTSGAIYLLQGAVLDGRAISISGAISLDEITAVGCDASGSPLMIDLLNFTAFTENKEVTLSWSTAAEYNNDFFTIERSIDGLLFETIGNIAGAGNSNIKSDYKVVDAIPILSLVYYRLSQTDYDGTTIILKTIAVTEKVLSQFIISPNPANGNIKINSASITDLKSNNVEFTLYYSNGQYLLQAKINELTTFIETGIITPGIYLYSIHNPKEILQSGKIVLK